MIKRTIKKDQIRIQEEIVLMIKNNNVKISRAKSKTEVLNSGNYSRVISKKTIIVN